MGGFKFLINNCIAKMEVGCQMKTAPMTDKSWQPSHEPHTVRGTGTHHTVETVEKGRKRGWEGNCQGDELPYYKTPENTSCMYATLRYATIHNHMELRHTRICVNTADLQGNASALCC